ncbi:MAG: carbohydrate kinase family protein [Bacteriovoracaceae bacterium]|nr:carbohydrate kinase family protein [Bacteriovoracaceae bacterium]
MKNLACTAKLSVVGLVFSEVHMDRPQSLPNPGEEEFVNHISFKVGGAYNVAEAASRLCATELIYPQAKELSLFIQLADSSDKLILTPIASNNTSAFSLVFSDKSDRSFLSYALYQELTSIDLKKYCQTKFLHVCGLYELYALQEQLIKLKADGVEIFASGSWAPDKLQQISTEGVPSFLDCLIVNDKEWDVLGWSDEFAKEQSMNLKNGLVVTRGSKGVDCYARGKKFQYQLKKRLEVNTTGAGDSFAAGFIHAIMDGYSPFESIEKGSLVAHDYLTRRFLS